MLIPVPATCEELSVFAPSVVKAAIGPLIERFRIESGNSVAMQYGGTGLLVKRIDAGEQADVVILPDTAVAKLAASGLLASGSQVSIGSVGIGVAVAQGARIPDIATPDALRQALLEAHRIAAIRPENSTSGKHFAEVLERLGIADAIRPKLLLIDHGYVAQRVAAGEADLGIQQITEILPVSGARLVGPLPPALQETTTYVAAPMKSSRWPASAAAFVKSLASEQARAQFEAHGFSPGP